jgi:hypothetical protein
LMQRFDVFPDGLQAETSQDWEVLILGENGIDVFDFGL